MQESGQITKWPSGITVQIIACRPRSRGSIKLASNSISKPPQIDLGYLTDAQGADRATLREGLRASRELALSSAFERYIEAEMHPGSIVKSDEEFDAYIDRTLHSANAIVGTCKLGPEGDGVVSEKDFTVHGTAGLRVIDSSVMPGLPGGQAGAPTAMIAERAAAIMTQGADAAAAQMQRELAVA